nr:ester cyclase [uncultured Mucilaginibacter sp.]
MSTVFLKAACLGALVFAVSCQPKLPEPQIERNKRIAERYFNEVWNKGHVALLDSLLTKDYINNTPSAPTVPGPDGLKPIVLAIRRAFPDLHFEIKEIISARDHITIRTVMTGTHKDTLFGIPPTGKHISVNQINIEKLKDGRIAEHWRVTDELTMMKQLGIVRL